MGKAEERIDVSFLREVLAYDRRTGVFTWLKNCGRGRVGAVAGAWRCTDGYTHITVRGITVLAHRLVWFFETGEWPKGDIDHINGVVSDSRFSNLREATRSQNMMNTGLRRDNISGVKGVHWCSTHERWVAEIKANGKRHRLGTFRDKSEAIAARETAAKKYHKDFARA